MNFHKSFDGQLILLEAILDCEKELNHKKKNWQKIIG